MTLLAIDHLTLAVPGARLVDDVSLRVDRGERVGLIGESGSGKSLTCMAALGLLPVGVQAHGRITLDGVQLLGAAERTLRGVRGRTVSCVFQEPQSALDPLMTIGRHLLAPLRAHRMLVRGSETETAIRLAESVGLPDPERIIRRYPHELSGGQRQRVMIAMAMSTDPALLLADEPTTALDVTVQRRVLDLMTAVTTSRGSAMLLVTHDMAVAASRCDRLLVMQAGRIVEEGTPERLLHRPAHPYTQRLVDAAYATSWQPATTRELVAA